MTTTMRNKSEAMAAIHETAQGLTDVGVVSKQTMRKYDEMCLVLRFAQ